MIRSEHVYDERLETVRRYRGGSVLGAAAVGLLLGAGGVAMYKAIEGDPLEQSTVVAIEQDTTVVPEDLPVGATVMVDFSVAEHQTVPVEDAILNIQNRFYADSAAHDAIVNFEVPEGYYAYKVQCDSGDLSADTLIQSSTFTCDFAIYPDGFRPATD